MENDAKNEQYLEFDMKSLELVEYGVEMCIVLYEYLSEATKLIATMYLCIFK